jgi:hypothetical protein
MPAVSAVIADHIAAVNAFDTDAIRRFMEKEFVGDRVTMEVREVIDHYGDTIVRAR